MTSVYLPFRADTDWKGVDKSYKRGLLLEFDDKSAFWAFQFVSNWLNMNFKNMSEQVSVLKRHVRFPAFALILSFLVKRNE